VSVERKVLALTQVLREFLPEDMAEERARNIVQAMADEAAVVRGFFWDLPDPISVADKKHRQQLEVAFIIQHRRELVLSALEKWELAPRDWDSTGAVLRVLEVLLWRV